MVAHEVHETFITDMTDSVSDDAPTWKPKWGSGGYGVFEREEQLDPQSRHEVEPDFQVARLSAEKKAFSLRRRRLWLRLPECAARSADKILVLYAR